MASAVDNVMLRSSSSFELARYFQRLLQQTHWKLISDHLYANIDTGAIPATVVHIFLSVCKDPGAVAEALRQNVSAHARYLAIRRFGKLIRSDNGCMRIWEAVGGTVGLLRVMAVMSVNHVNMLCGTIRESSTAQGASSLRQRCMTELFYALHNANGEDPDFPMNPDKRPLRTAYKLVLPACTSEAVLKLTAKSYQPNGRACQAHASAYEKWCMATVLPMVGEGKKTTTFKFLLDRSLDFSLGVLEKITNSKRHLETHSKNFVHDLAVPLTRRLRNRRAKDHVQIRVYSLIIQCVQAEPSIAEEIGREVISEAVQAWKRAREGRQDLEDMLATLIRLTCDYRLSQITYEMGKVGPSLRFPLLQLFLRHAKCFNINIDLSSGEIDKKVRSISETWDPRLFFLLPSGIAVRLFNYLRKAYRNGRFVTRAGRYGSATIMKHSMIEGDQYGDPDVLAALLNARDYRTRRYPGTSKVGTPSYASAQEEKRQILEDDHSWKNQTKRVLQERKQKAMTARDPDARASWAQSVMCLSIASGSLDGYTETALWARRFNRDVKTVKTIYSSDTALADEGLDLLRALPEEMTYNEVFLTAVKDDVEKANRHLMYNLETLSMCLREPSFDFRDMTHLWSQPYEVVRRRIERIDSMEGITRLSDDDIYRAVWEPTIEMVLGVERFGLRHDYGQPGLKGLGGIFQHQTFHQKTKRNSRKFLDKLALARDKLWQEYRPTVHPAATTIPSPWPKGLPIQHLCWVSLESYRDMDYLQSRAEVIVLSRGEAVLAPPPAGEEMREAIGPFVDNYKYALRVFALAVEEGQERESRILQAWDHALSELTGSRMPKEEAGWFWRGVFRSTEGVHLPEVVDPALKYKDPQLPANSSGDPVEWDPDPNNTFAASKLDHHKVKPQKLPEACLDSMLQTHDTRSIWSRVDVHTRFCVAISLKVDGERYPTIWKMHSSPIKLPQTTRDALAAAAIAYVNAQCGSDGSLLMRSYPSSDDRRFPPFYLHKEFLERESKRSSLDTVLLTIAKLSAAVPIPLIEQLARSLLIRLEKNETEDQKFRQAVIAVVKRLARADRPSAACEFVRRIILERQDDSSWHRRLFNAKFLRNLPAQDAKSFFSDLSSEIQDKLLQQSERRRDVTEANESQAPLVKVTTVKMIAQILRGADYMDEEFSRGVLVGLFNGATHADIRIAVVESLLSLWSDTDKDELKSDIVDILAEHVVPIASSLNERRPITEDEWLEAEERAGKLPEVYEASHMSELPPIMKLLVDAIPTVAKDSDEFGQRSQEVWMRRVIIPMLQQSAANHKRWTSLFLKRNGFGITGDSLPEVPLKPKLLPDLFEAHIRFFPKSTFKQIVDLSMVHISPPESINAVHAAVKDDPDLVNSSAGKQWLFAWSSAGHTSQSLELWQSAELLVEPQVSVAPEDSGGATVTTIQKFLLDVSEVYLAASETNTYDSYVNYISMSGRVNTQEKHRLWQANCLPLLERFINRIDSLRTEEWQRNPKRWPSKLPDTFSIKLCMLEVRHWQFSEQAMPQLNVGPFVADVTSLLEEVTANDRPYHDRWLVLKNAVLGFRDDQNFRLALGFGSFDRCRWPTLRLVDHLCIELADALVLQAGDPRDQRVCKDVKKMLEGWIACHVEGVRCRGDLILTTLIREPNKADRFRWFKDAVSGDVSH